MALGTSRPVLPQVGLMAGLVGSIVASVTLNVGLVGAGRSVTELFGQITQQCHVARR